MLKFRIGLQFFAEGDPSGGANNTDPAPSTGKTFSEDYVKTLREESKENRIARKAAEEKAAAIEAKFKALLGLKEPDAIDDSKIAAFQQAQQAAAAAAVTKANARLIQAEIRSLEGYDAKLVERLLDKSKIAIAEDGTVTGLKEAVEAMAVEFPAVKKAAAGAGGNPANPAAPANLNTIESLKAEYTAALAAGKTAEAIALKSAIFREEHKK